MAAYSYYSQDYYFDAEYELKRFLKVYPNKKVFHMHITYLGWYIMKKL